MVPNELIEPNQLTLQQKMVFIVLLRYASQDESCFPSQTTIAKSIGCSPRYVRTILGKLEAQGLIYSKRLDYNRTNTYQISKHLIVDDRNSSSPHLRSIVPLQNGTTVPPTYTHRNKKDKRSDKGFQLLKETVREMGLLRIKNELDENI
jgi:DNA-binding Lrp family transcriptional regulator